MSNLTTERSSGVIYINANDSILKVDITFKVLWEVAKPIFYIDGNVANLQPDYYLENEVVTLTFFIHPDSTYSFYEDGSMIIRWDEKTWKEIELIHE